MLKILTIYKSVLACSSEFTKKPSREGSISNPASTASSVLGLAPTAIMT